MADRVVRMMCRGEKHSIRLVRSRGEVELSDHNVRAEMALVGLGGEICTCLAVGVRLDLRNAISRGDRDWLWKGYLGGAYGEHVLGIYRASITDLVDRAEDGAYGVYRLVVR